MYPFGIKIEKSKVLIANNKPINIQDLIKMHKNNKEFDEVFPSNEKEKNNRKIKKPT